MANTLISLIGDQTAPNVILILDKAFEAMDRYVFVTSLEMEQKRRSDHLVLALKLTPDQYQKVIVRADDLLDIREKMEVIFKENPKDQYFINLTGGTKMMSIGVFAFFSQVKARTRIYYIPVRQQVFWQIFPSQEHKMLALTATIDLATYLTSYGVKWVDNSLNTGLTCPISYTKKLFELFLDKKTVYTKREKNFTQFIHFLRKQYNKNRGYPVDYTAIEELDVFLKESEFPARQNHRLSPAEIVYLIGGWFEEWVYYHIKTRLGLAAEDIWRNARVQGMNPEHELSDHEFDILFMFQNTLYLIECKLGLGSRYEEVKSRLKEALYRLRVLNRALGIHVPTGFLTLSDQLSNKTGTRRKAFEEQTHSLRITLLDRHDLHPDSDDWVLKLVPPLLPS